MARELKKIKARYPDLKISTTSYDSSYGGAGSMLGPYVDIWIPITRGYERDLSVSGRLASAAAGSGGISPGASQALCELAD